MKFYRLYNLTELEPAAALHFLKRESAEKYRELVKWPYANDGLWPLHKGGSIPLASLDLRVESVELPAVVLDAFDIVVFEREGKLGSAPYIPGECFNPDEWQPCSALDLASPVLGPRLLEAQLKVKDQAAHPPKAG